MTSPTGQIARYVGKWARLWLARHPGCQNHRECQQAAERDR